MRRHAHHDWAVPGGARQGLVIWGRVGVSMGVYELGESGPLALRISFTLCPCAIIHRPYQISQPLAGYPLRAFALSYHWTYRSSCSECLEYLA